MDEDELIALLSGIRPNPVRVCRISDKVARAIGAHTSVVWLSHATANKQEAKRDINERALYLKSCLILKEGYPLIKPPRHAIYIYHERTDKLRSYQAVVKATRSGNEIYLVSVHRVDRTGVRSAFKQAIRLTEWERGRREVGPPKNPT